MQALIACMPAKRISKEKRVLIIGALAEGTPINGVARMSGVAKESIFRVIEETGEALASYMMANFRNLRCSRVEMDEQWQYVGMHGQRMARPEFERGDFWLWAAIDADTKLVFSYRVGRRDSYAAEDFVADASKRVVGPVQVCTDAHRHYVKPLMGYFSQPGASYATEAKHFEDGFRPEGFQERRKNGVKKIAKAERKEIYGQPDLSTATTAHIERLFLSVRQELTRFTRCTLGYSKDLRMHKLSIHLHMGLYNLARKHTTLGGATPAMAAGIENHRWSLDEVVTETERYWQAKEEAAFEAAFAARYKN